MPNSLILGDNLEVMQSMADETVDLIYLDPPFFSNRDYEVIWGDEGEVRSFQDRWEGGIEHYISWLKERVVEMHRLLRPTGSIFLHCDWHASHYIKVEILDRLFGRNNFRNEIIWCYMGPGSPGVKQFLKKHDSIFWYSKSEAWTFNLDDIRFTHSEKTLSNFKAGLGGSGFDGAPRVLNQKGKVPEDWWTDIAVAARFPKNSDNNLGYPTQKPVALLERILRCASNEGDTVLDPFVGGGTTVAVADKLKRHWIGIDQSVAAVKVTDLRLRRQRDLYSEPYELRLRKFDYDALRSQDAFEFERWIIELIGGIANAKQRSDLGLDGKMHDGTPIQVKRSDNIGRNVIDNFLSSVQRYDEQLFERNKAEEKPVGIIIGFSFGKGAVEEVARLKNRGIRIELKKVNDIAPYGNRPKVSLTADEVELQKYLFQASAESETGISFFSWDFNHNPAEGFKPEVILDKAGKQVRKFAPGKHHIAVEAVDNNGLEGMGELKLQIRK